MTVDLNEAQQRVVESVSHHLSLCAPPGTGKTECLALRIRSLVKERGFSPSSVLCITHTNAATDTMRDRLRSIIGEKEAMEVVVSTLHGLACELLPPPKGFYLATALQRRLAAQAATIHGNTEVYYAMDRQTDQDVVAWLERRVEDARQRIAADPDNQTRRGGLKAYAASKLKNLDRLLEDGRAYPVYRRLLRGQRCFLYDDMITNAVRHIKADAALKEKLGNRFSHVMIDEFQDVSRAQEELLECFCGPGTVVSVAGDERQSIYGFQGATTGAFDRFESARGGRVVKVTLDTNYRSTGAIQAAFMRGIGSEYTGDRTGAVPRVLRFSSQESELAGVALLVESKIKEGVAPSDIVVLGKTHVILGRVAEVLEPICAVVSSKRANVLQQPAYPRCALYARYVELSMDPSANPDDVRGTLFRIFQLLHPIGDVADWSRNKTDERRGVFADTMTKLDRLTALSQAGVGASRLLAEMRHSLMPEPHHLGFFRTVTKNAHEEEQKGTIASLPDYISILNRMVEERLPLDEEPPFCTTTATGGVVLSTCHASKSQGFPHVIMVGCSDREWRTRMFLHDEITTTREQMELETTRLFHVAMSRAKENLTMTYHGSPFHIIEELGDTVISEACDHALDEGKVLDAVFPCCCPVAPHSDTLLLPAMSSTLLQDVEDCPTRAYYVHVESIRLPAGSRVAFEAAEVGRQVHRALEALFKKEPQQEVPASKRDLFDSFCESRKPLWDGRTSQCNRVIAEHRLDALLDGTIPITGRVDRWDEFEDGRVIITDYKTGKRNPKHLTEPRSRLRTQAAFYTMLAEKHGYRVECVEFEFLDTQAPDRVLVSESEVRDVEERVRAAHRLLSTSEELPLCGKPNCSWCGWESK